MKNCWSTKPLHELYLRAQGRFTFRRRTTDFLVRTAQTFQGGSRPCMPWLCDRDINQSSILVSKAPTVALIDLGQLQVSKRIGDILLSGWSPGIHAAELQGVSLAKVPRNGQPRCVRLAIASSVAVHGPSPLSPRASRRESPRCMNRKDSRFGLLRGQMRHVSAPGTLLWSASQRAWPVLRSGRSDVKTVIRVQLLSNDRHPGEFWRKADPVRWPKLHWHPVEASKCPWCEMKGLWARRFHYQ